MTVGSLVEFVRTARGPRQRNVATISKLPGLDREERISWYEIGRILSGKPRPRTGLFAQPEIPPPWATVNLSGVSVERLRHFGDVYLELLIWTRLGFAEFCKEQMPSGREEIPWSIMAVVLVLARFCASSPELFGSTFDFMFYDIPSIYFEGSAKANPQAKRGYSRDGRLDYPQVCIGLVTTREGLPLAFEVFDGNRPDVTTTQEVVEIMEAKYGIANRVWVMDHGMVSEDNLEYLRSTGARYLVGTPKLITRNLFRLLWKQPLYALD